ncbi:PREDICTED: uncharacterized protein LOC107186280 [Dufourea novaeangliae]|uniref:uncharacterized protein LOC107186280 n=1 Tax=Dufourea novaeangliae TaxID=178035 RepID=UPI000766F9DA|nr:PREDICTED: uncharacterized protein LOC107186280 [Dufourea novaeangliae]
MLFRLINSGDAVFICAGTDCAFPGEQPNCFFRHTPNSCCGGTQVCLKEGEERATCEVDGKIYKDGEYFEPKSDPELDCYCMPGYKGENVEPFCKRPKHRYCSPLFRNPGSVLKQCAPVFYDGQNSRTDCSYATRCPNANDTIIHKHDNTKAIETDEGKMCRFGDLLMHIGDELKEGTDPQSSCMKCVCELPPHPTCQKRTDRECGFLWNLSDDMVTVEPTDSITPIA